MVQILQGAKPTEPKLGQALFTVYSIELGCLLLYLFLHKFIIAYSRNTKDHIMCMFDPIF